MQVMNESKLRVLRAEAQRGIDAIGRGSFSAYEEGDLEQLARQVKARARERQAPP